MSGTPALKGSPKRVLVVDDDRDMREALTDILEFEGYVVSCAADGSQALRVARADPPHLILLDLMMPVMSGWQFRAAQRLDPVLSKVPVVVMSAFAHEVEAAALLPKPFQLGEVLDTIRRLAA
ncbi:MAG TPA: response regulator [Anaeromyxobacteraceae bacterium]|nr:response regulator [Anaeromyxobacteraceae bacterium]